MIFYPAKARELSIKFTPPKGDRKPCFMLTFQEHSILSTLTFFDIFNYPLTTFEVWKWQYQAQSSKLKTQSYNSELKASEIQTLLETNENLQKVVESKNGLYFLKGRKELVTRRLNLYREAEARWRKLKKIATVLQIVPNVLMIAACNTLPINDFKAKSDIDAFIIVKKKRLWLTRFLVTVLVALFGQWRHKKNIAGRICLSFYITDEALNLRSIAKSPYDIYLTYWVALVAPVYNFQFPIPNFQSNSKFKNYNIYQQFLSANFWVREYLPNFIGFEPVENERKVKDIWIFKTIKRISEGVLNTKLGDFLENLFRKIQKDKMAKNYQSAYRKGGSDVIISDKMLKFHEIDRRDEFRKRFELKLTKTLNYTQGVIVSHSRSTIS
jgi:hypothetical protein